MTKAEYSNECVRLLEKKKMFLTHISDFVTIMSDSIYIGVISIGGERGWNAQTIPVISNSAASPRTKQPTNAFHSLATLSVSDARV